VRGCGHAQGQAIWVSIFVPAFTAVQVAGHEWTFFGVPAAGSTS
jgi:hypothetical protein